MLRPRVRVELVDDRGVVVVDYELALVLLGVDVYGSLLRAARAAGLAYSRAWERVERAGRLLGGRLVEARRGGRGGGGARLTGLGREVLARYLEAYRAVTGSRLSLPPQPGGGGGPVYVYAGSHDHVLEHMLAEARAAGVAVEHHWIGSMAGVAAVLLGEADLAGLHVSWRGGSNLDYLRSTLPPGSAVMISGYERRLVLASREGLTPGEAARGLLAGRLRLANRPRGSGARLALDSLLAREAARLGLGAGGFEGRVRGYDSIARTHDEAAGMVARGEADVAVVCEAAAAARGLQYHPLGWERFDFAAPRESLSTPLVEAVRAVLSDRERLEAVLSRLPGYRPLPDSGSVTPL